VCDVVLLKYNEQAREQRFIIYHQEFGAHSKQRGTRKSISPNGRFILCTETYLLGVVFVTRNIAGLGPKEAVFLVLMAAEKSAIFTFKEAHEF